jgi:hypothetical protein
MVGCFATMQSCLFPYQDTFRGPWQVLRDALVWPLKVSTREEAEGDIPRYAGLDAAIIS